MEINYELSPQDFVKYSKAISKSANTHLPMVFLFTSIALLFIFADFFYVYFAGTMDGWTVETFLLSLGIRLLIALGLLGIIAVVLNFILLRFGNKISENPKNGVLCKHKIILNENELVEITDVNTSHYSWHGIGKIKEIEEFIIIEVLSSSSYVIPTRFFQNRTQIEKFIETATFYRQNSIEAFSPPHLAGFEENS